MGDQKVISLEEALVVIETLDESASLMHLLMTEHEIQTFQHRWEAFQLSLGGATQREVRARARVAMATAARSARAVRQNPQIIRTLLERATRKR